MTNWYDKLAFVQTLWGISAKFDLVIVADGVWCGVIVRGNTKCVMKVLIFIINN